MTAAARDAGPWWLPPLTGVFHRHRAGLLGRSSASLLSVLCRLAPLRARARPQAPPPSSSGLLDAEKLDRCRETRSSLQWPDWIGEGTEGCGRAWQTRRCLWGTPKFPVAAAGTSSCTRWRRCTPRPDVGFDLVRSEVAGIGRRRRQRLRIFVSLVCSMSSSILDG